MKQVDKNGFFLNELLNSKSSIILLVIIACFLLLVIVFKLGVTIGFEKAKFSYKWADNYYKNFTEQKPFDDKIPPHFLKNDDIFMNSHGIVGDIISINGNSLVIENKKDNVENIILLSDETTIKGPQNLTLKDLKINDEIVCIGEPNKEGIIEAKLIRIMFNNKK